MTDDEFRLQREVRELKAEVRRLQHIIQGGLAAGVLVAVIFVPQLLVLAAGLGAAILFAFLVSPYRRMIFSSFSRNPDGQEFDPK
jgi:uncharacterized protein (DUF2062 family)